MVVVSVDAVTGPRLSLALFYLAVVLPATVALGRRWGLVFTAASVAAGLVTDVLVQPAATRAVPAWNVLLAGVIFVGVVFIVAALQDALASARAAEERSRAFLAVAAHQLRTPIAGIQASAETLLLEPGGEGAEEMLASVGTEAARLSRMVAAMLRIARLDQGEALPPQPCDMGPVCATEIGRQQRRAPELRFELDAPAGAVALINPDAAAEIVGNLLDNARRHARSIVTVSVTTEAGWVTVAVSDDGAGVPTDVSARMFDRFVSLDGHRGAGLGLPIARLLARISGGDVIYERGRFVVRCPAVDA